MKLKGVSFGERSQTREVDNEAFTNYMGAMTMDTYKYALQVTDRYIQNILIYSNYCYN